MNRVWCDRFSAFFKRPYNRGGGLYYCRTKNHKRTKAAATTATALPEKATPLSPAKSALSPPAALSPPPPAQLSPPRSTPPPLALVSPPPQSLTPAVPSPPTPVPTHGEVAHPIYRIIDRSIGPRGFLYRVLWKHGPGRHRFLPTYEPRRKLVEDGQANPVQLVDDWINGGKKRTFLSFLRARGDVDFTAALPKGDCALVALEIAVRSLHVPEWYNPLSRYIPRRSDQGCTGTYLGGDQGIRCCLQRVCDGQAFHRSVQEEPV
jgi:hypothetical protein